ncbi:MULTISPECIES: peptidylprolyl isomerase [Sphingobacterium]|nr:MULTISPECIES: peptidylprolyl isomerase [unclassified Sphingobacterium]
MKCKPILSLTYLLILFHGCRKEEPSIPYKLTLAEAKTFYESQLIQFPNQKGGDNFIFQLNNLVVDWSDFMYTEKGDLRVTTKIKSGSGNNQGSKLVGHYELYFSKDMNNQISGMIKYRIKGVFNGQGGYIAYDFKGKLIPPKQSPFANLKDKLLMGTPSMYMYKNVLFAQQLVCQETQNYFDLEAKACKHCTQHSSFDPSLIFQYTNGGLFYFDQEFGQFNIDVSPAYWQIWYEGEEGFTYELRPLYEPMLDDNNDIILDENNEPILNPGIVIEEVVISRYSLYNWSSNNYSFNPYFVLNTDYDGGLSGGTEPGGAGQQVTNKLTKSPSTDPCAGKAAVNERMNLEQVRKQNKTLFDLSTDYEHFYRLDMHWVTKQIKTSECRTDTVRD